MKLTEYINTFLREGLRRIEGFSGGVQKKPA
jgi:hypothetical protein